MQSCRISDLVDFLGEIDAGSNDAPSVEVEAYVPSSPEQWYDEAPSGAAYQVGQSVWHGQYGQGTVSGLSKGKTSVVTVRFPGVGQKRRFVQIFFHRMEMRDSREW